MKFLLLLINIFVFQSAVLAQVFSKESIGLQIGIATQFGTHINQIGFKIQGYYHQNIIQLNFGSQLNFSFEDIGDRTNFLQSRNNIGIVILGGRQNGIPNIILEGLNHQTLFQNAIGYNYVFYLDRKGCSQNSGGMAIHLSQFSFLIENDFFAGQGKDRFRTSFTKIAYHTEFWNLSLNTILFTGETGGVLKTNDHLYPATYKNLSESPYGRKSHGIVEFQFDYLLLYGNVGNFILGLDHEKIRNALQNKLMHDKKFVPKKIRRTNPHYPMLNTNGVPYFMDSQPIKPIALKVQTGLNISQTY